MQTIRAFALALVVAVACKQQDPVATPVTSDIQGELGSGPAGVYVLRTIAGHSLPAVVASHESYHAVMLADTIFLHADGSGGRAAVMRVTEDPAVGERQVREGGTFTYEVSGDHLTVEYPCNDVIVLAACAAPPHFEGSLTTDGLDLDKTVFSYRMPLRYAKVAGPSPVAAVRITPTDNVVVDVGGTLRLTASALDASGQPVAGRTASWRAFPSSHATVDGGTVRGIRRGIAFVTASIDGREATVRVEVK
jgi:hypothetical protein